MLSRVLVGSVLAVSPPALPEDPPATVDAAGPAADPAAPEPPADAPAPEPELAPAPELAPIVVESAPASLPPAFPDEGPDEGSAAATPAPIVIVDRRASTIPSALPAAPAYTVPAPPWSGSGRFVGGAVMLVAGTGLLTAATLEFADGRDTTQPVISQVPAGVAMLIAGGVMIGTAARDQHRLAEWEAATRIDARPAGNGLIVGGVTMASLGVMAAIATSIAVDMELDAPRSIPAGWATAGVGMGVGTALLITGIVRRSRYGDWREGLRGAPMVTPTRAGATVGLVGQF